MPQPPIVLRFRDTTAGVDTISAHRAVIAEKGHVLWGWWKPYNEDVPSDEITALFSSNDELHIILLDRSTERMFEAKCSGWITQPTIEQLELVPAYYRDKIDDVAAFFNLNDILEVKYNKTIGDAIGDGTLGFTEHILNNPDQVDVTESHVPGRASLLLLSDLHFGADYGFLKPGQESAWGQKQTLTTCILADLKRISAATDIAAVVVTGDFITAGEWDDAVRGAALAEFAALRSALGLEPEQIVAVPGNHDIVRYPHHHKVDVAKISVDRQTSKKHEREFATFVEELTGRHWKAPFEYVTRLELAEVDVLLCVLNSCAITATEWTEYGFVGEKGFDVIRELSAQKTARPTYKILALHHHLLPVTEVEAPNKRGVSLTLDAARLLDEAQRVGIQIVLHGHQHLPRLAKYQSIPFGSGMEGRPLFIFSNGSSGVARERIPGDERNVYGLLKLTANDAQLVVRELRNDAKAGASIFDGSLEAAEQT